MKSRKKSLIGRQRLFQLFLLLLSAIFIITACTSQENSDGPGNTDNTQTPKPNNEQKEDPKPIEAEPQEPVTLQFYTATVIGDFEEFVNQYVKEEFPHITLELVENKEGTRLQELIAANAIPDIIWQGLTNLGGQLADLQVPMDLEPLAKKHGFDFGVFDEKMVESIRSYSPEGKLIYLPYNVLVFATHYNKEIFDRFGVDYPKDHMTWNELTELGRRLTRTEDGTQYIGLRPTLNSNRVQGQLSLGYVNPDTGQADLNNDGWKRLFNTFKMIEDLTPGDRITSLFAAREEFLNKRTVAIMPDILQLQNTDMPALEAEGFMWDVVTYPSYEDLPGVGPKIFSDGFILANGSKNPDAAFQVIAYLSTNYDVQLEATQNGRITGLTDSSILEHAFENNPAAQGKNLDPIFETKYPESYYTTRYDASIHGILNRKLMEYINGNTDVNTLLLQAEEEANQKIAEMKAAE